MQQQFIDKTVVMEKSDLTQLLSVSEAARVLELSAQRLRTLADAGIVPCLRTPLGRLFDPSDLERFRATRGPFGRYVIQKNNSPQHLGKTP